MPGWASDRLRRPNPVAANADAQGRPGTDRTLVRSIGAPYEWIKRGGARRALIIYPLILITLGYVAMGLFLRATDSTWSPADTFSMVAGCIFFVIGTGLAVALEAGQEAQRNVLDEVRELTGKTWRHLDPHKPVQAAGTREVLTEQPTMPAPHDRAAAVVKPETDLASSSEAKDGLENQDENATDSWEESWGKLADLEDLSPVGLAEESLRLFEAPDEQEKVLQRFALESAIDVTANAAAVESLLRQTQLYTLGHPAGDISIAGHGTESDILHFTIDESQGVERTYMPLFTRADVMRKSLLRNPGWQELSILEVNGGDLIVNRDADVTLVINPWSKLEFQLGPRQDQVT